MIYNKFVVNEFLFDGICCLPMNGLSWAALMIHLRMGVGCDSRKRDDMGLNAGKYCKNYW